MTDVAVRDQEYESDAICKEIKDVDENKVNQQLKNLRPLGKWTPWNQCQSFAQDVLNNARTNKRNSNQNDNHTTNPYYSPWVPRSSI